MTTQSDRQSDGADRYSCPCGIGDEPCPDERGELLCAPPSPAVAAEPVSDERALELAHSICTGKLSAVQGAVEIMQYATDGVLQVQAASPPVRRDREKLYKQAWDAYLESAMKPSPHSMFDCIKSVVDAVDPVPPGAEPLTKEQAEDLTRRAT